VGRFILRRLLGSAVTLYVIVTLSFFMMRFAPGGPFSDDRNVPPQILAALEAKYHLDEALPTQYVRFLAQVAQGDLGESMGQRGRPVTQMIANLAPQSFRLGVLALALAISVGVTLGIMSALYQNSVADYAAMALALVGIAAPTFVVAEYAVRIFSLWLGWVSPGQLYGVTDYILPSVCLAVPFIAVIARLSRAGMLEVLSQDYILTAKAKGVAGLDVITVHALKGALLPVVTYLGPAAAGILVGGVVVEQIFVIDGIGPELVRASFGRDYPLVIGLIIVYSTLLILFNVIVDVAYAWLDPRVRLE
jgi:oligopeptide transport system permease protein